MTILNIEGKQVQVDDSFMKLSPEDQDSTVQEIAHSLGAGSGAQPAAAPDIGDSRASVTAALRGIPIAGAYTDKVAAALNAAAQPITETGLSHAPTFGQRYSENVPKIKAGTDAFETSHPIGTTVGKMALGTAATLPLAASATAARALGMSGTLPQMMRNGMMSGAAIGGADAAARGDDVGTGAVESGIAGGVLPVAARGIAAGVRGVRNLVSSAPRTPLTAPINGVPVPVPESYVSRDNAAGSQENLARAGAIGPEAQRVAAGADQATADATKTAADRFSQGLADPNMPSVPATPHVAADQTITELAQQHNDQITAQARHDAQIAAEGTAVRGDVRAPLGAPEPAQPPTVADAITGIQGGIQQRAAQSAQTRTNLYQAAGQIPGDFSPAAFGEIGNSVRNQIERGGQAAGVRPVTINPQLTPHADAMLSMLDNRLGNNYYENALRRGDMVRLPDGRVVPRPLTPADVEAARQEMVSHVRDANNAARAPGGSGTDAYAAQRVMDAFNRHHNAVLDTPGAFSGDGPAYRRAIDAARAAHSQHRGTFSNQGNGDTVGPVIERIIGRHAGQQMPVGQMATLMFGTPASPGGGNSLAIAQRVRQIVGDNSPEWQAARQGMLSHLLDHPEGMEPLAPGKQADRLHSYVQTPHARELFTAPERTRLMAHANDLRAQAAPRPAPSPIGRQMQQLASGESSPTDLVKKIFPASGQITPEAEHLLDAIHASTSTRTWNSVRQAMWSHLLERPEGITEFGPQALSQRLARFLSSPIARSMYSEQEVGVMRQFAEHYAKLAPMPNTTNPSGSATMAAKLVRGMGNHIFTMLGFATGGGHLGGAIIGAGVDKAATAVKTARQVEKTKELFLGKKPKGALNKNYERAAAVISHAATPLLNSGQ